MFRERIELFVTYYLWPSVMTLAELKNAVRPRDYDKHMYGLSITLRHMQIFHGCNREWPGLIDSAHSQPVVAAPGGILLASSVCCT